MTGSKYNAIAEQVNNGNYEEALGLLLPIMDNGQYDDEIAVLASTINYSFGYEEEAYKHIIKGLRYKYSNYELYLMLGDYYRRTNNNLSQLCYENALYYCIDSEDDRRYIEEILKNCKGNTAVLPLHICIIDNGNNELTTQCKKSISDTCSIADSNIHIVDGNKGLNEWVGSINCECDILILSNHVMVMPNSIFCLRMGLYDDKMIGVVGAVENISNASQQVDYYSDNKAGYEQYAVTNNIPCKDGYEVKTWLEGNALMLKSSLFKRIGGIDLDYYDGMMIEYQDFCMKILGNGFRNILCWNSFIYCSSMEGAYSLTDNSVNRARLDSNIQLFEKRWGFHPGYYTQVREDILSLIPIDSAQINVLEVGCGTGNTLGRVKKMFPDANVKGIELVNSVAEIGRKNFDIICGDVENMELTYSEGEFDYIIFGDVLEHLKDPWFVLRKIYPYLKEDGCVLTSIPNIMNAEIIYELLCGNFTYMDSGILDRTHLRFFTYKEIIKMFEKSGYKVDEIYRNVVLSAATEQYKEIFQAILPIKGVASKEEFDTYQYIIKARKC